MSLLLSLPPNSSHPPTLITNLSNPQYPVDAWSQGSFAYLPNGNFFLGYGSNAVVAEYGPIGNGTEGQVRWTAAFGYGDLVSSYRAYKQPWHATPLTSPSLVVLQAGQGDALSHCAGSAEWRGYVSWNGATDVTDWLIFAGSTNTTLQVIGKVRKMGFETEFVVPEWATFVQVGALERHSNITTEISSVVAVGSQ